MTIRITYVDHKDGYKKSLKYRSEKYDCEYYIKLFEYEDPEAVNYFQIVNSTRGEIVYCSKAAGRAIKNHNVLRRSAKQKLSKFGVTFDIEVRDRDYFSKEKGQ